MPNVVTINRAEVVALIETAAAKFTSGNKTAAVALALQKLLEQDHRSGSLLGAHPGSVRVAAGIDLTAPTLTDPLEAENGLAWRAQAAGSKGLRRRPALGRERR